MKLWSEHDTSDTQRSIMKLSVDKYETFFFVQCVQTKWQLQGVDLIVENWCII
jgi:hypothetical protein